MVEIKIIFFALLTFFGIEDGRIAANKTTVTIQPDSKQVEIIQEGLFAFIEKDSDIEAVSNQWYELLASHKTNLIWSKELESFTNKTLRLDSINGNVRPSITLNYSSENDLRIMGIWYDEDDKVFSINHIPKEHLETKDGKIEGNYWKFDATKPISFSMQSFKNIPERYLKFKRSIEAVIKKDKD